MSDAGLTILIGTAVYGFSIIVLGILTDKGLSKMFLIVAGSVAMDVSVVLYAPSMFGLHWNSIIPPAMILIVPFHIALSAVYVSVVPLLILHDPEPDHIKSSQRASGIFLSMYLVGMTVGPLIIAALLDTTTFSVCSFIVAVINFMALAFTLGIHFKNGNLLTIESNDH